MNIFTLLRRKIVLFFLAVFLFALGGVCQFKSHEIAHIFQMQKPVYQGNISKKCVSFTVNVDWGEEYIMQMLSIFEKSNIKATFFLTGRWAQEHPQLVKKIALAGHEIGNHGFSHPHVNDLTVEDNVKEISLTSDVIYRISKQRTKFFAPPYGEFNENVLKAAQKTNHLTILWTVDTVDWKNPPNEWVVSHVLNNVKNGAIILMHPTAVTVNILPEIIKGIIDQGYSIVPLEKLILN